ncbi:XRE family transcriptional regulator [Accumulibacter sp.]|uniref:helix-turn-helix domain-containing protein n=1 Tax=Accumulibacter sp. TaxID=2053492 RepID=UPI002584C25D|nr:XRE family transcriptional regulator [Accumulibacter sp.]MDS4055367.1 XRE family transcriptional regulator [Accumulibacter sp.]
MIADRIRLARCKAGLSLRDLSTAMDGRVTAQAIGKYERGESTPSSGVLLALAKALDVSLSYLLDTQGIALSGVEFRTKANTTARDRAQVETEVLEWVERYLQIERILERDSAEWQCPLPSVRLLRSVGDAEQLANDVREKWELGLDPIPNMTELLEEKGLKVLTVPLPARVSGFTCLVQRCEATPLPVIVVSNQFTLERRRLTLAHELAHRLVDTESLADKDEEKAANVFAGALLMPRTHLEREVGKHRNAIGYKELIDLKRIYRVSGAALLVRLRQIEVISDATLTYAFQSIARTWRSQEPDELEPSTARGSMERAQRFERLCYWALAEGLISLSKASELLRASISDVERGLKGPPGTHAHHRQ